MQSSTKNQISGDGKLSFVSRFLYLYYCFCDICRDNSNSSGNPKIKKIREFQLKSYGIASKLYRPSSSYSPSRNVANMFLSAYFLKISTEVLPVNFHILDFGCGSGSYYSFLLNSSKNVPFIYSGIDIKARTTWDNETSNCRFYEFDGACLPDFGNIDLVFSFSCLEHILDDKYALDNLFDLNSSRGPQLSIHIVPGPLGLPGFLWHGYRQYTTSSISALVSNISSEKFSFDVVRLGSLFTFIAQFFLVRLPSLFGFKLYNSSFYRYLCAISYKLDMSLSAFLPFNLAMMYSIVIKRL